ncbi:xanthine dehydrogenase family protein molybdopterin-binding subunit [Rhodovarius crocodyli]|uniref:Xanthine dehydrogenase family protein molybdopterin-binding subunit n=1 Tax=Rhodovarius crocodyli TaxID=1979269 RepID=A0A437M3N2_9PROT|nr:xanthine dehydrogenase family protein molybdopterin-binding subunit [Rhodovarius crocodyli]RVT92309.1 xanthine dehydrogenase family protein molybdopterin-binding subunit [Rhodovarius crocodyli]
MAGLPDEPMNWIGRNIPRLEDPALVRGEGRFVADIAVGSRAVVFVRSPVAAGVIRGIEKPDLPRGVLVITGGDVAALKPIVPRLGRFNYVAIEQPILPRDRVHYVGQPVVAVVAPTQREAEDIADAVFLDIEPEQAVVDLDSAAGPGAPVVHPMAPTNTIVEGRIRTPGLDAVLAESTIVEIDVRSRRQNASPMETRGGAASFDKASGRVSLHASVQMPHMLRTGIADCIGMPEADLRVVAPDVGGGFGQKMSLFPEYVLLVWLARKYRTEVAWIEDRRENLIASAHSRDQHHIVRGAFDGQGVMRGLDVEILANIGAFSCYPTTCGVEPLMALAEYAGPYKVAEYGTHARGITTNTAVMAPYRGVSRPVVSFALERLMEVAAKRLNIDPIEIRRRNLVTVFPHRTPTNMVLDEASYLETMEKAVEVADLPGFRARQQAAREQGRYLGIGFSVINERTGYGTPAFAARSMEITPGYERVEICMTPSGEVEARIGASPHGQGLRTTLAQIIAEEVGVDVQRIRIIHGDTDRTPYGWGTFASRSLVIAGGASKLAAGKLAQKLKRAAAVLLQGEESQVRLEAGMALIPGGASISLDTIARTVYHSAGPISEKIGYDLNEAATYDPEGTFSNACHVAVVEVDAETGNTRILRYIVVEDAGRLINPMIVDGQVQGGVAQGIGNALLEEIIYDADGNILTGSFADFIPPTMAEVPDIEVHHLATLTGATVLQAKGVGEGGSIAAPAAVINAICDALQPFGVQLFEMPATPQRVRAAIRAAQETSP